MRRNGCFDYRPIYAYLSYAAHLSSSLAAFYIAANSPIWLSVPAFLVGSVLFYQIGFLMHDAAHVAVSGNLARDMAFAHLTATTLGEFLSGWMLTHNNHHKWTNVPDRESGLATRFDTSLSGRPRWLVFTRLYLVRRIGRIAAHQIYLPASLMLLGIRDGVLCYRKEKRSVFYRELACVLASHAAQIAFFVVLFGAGGVALYFLNTMVGFVYLNAVFVGNHYDQRVLTPSERASMGFLEAQLRTTQNYSAGWLSSYLCGGLQYHIEHHLFFRIPRHRLRRASAFIRAAAESSGLPYRTVPFFRAIGSSVMYHANR